MTKTQLNFFSDVITGDLTNGVPIAMWHNALRKAGWKDPADLHLPRVICGHFDSTANPCNAGLGVLANLAVEELRKFKIPAFTAGFASPNDAIAMGTDAMHWSLPMRDLAAWSMHAKVRAYAFDALLWFVDCDKTLPAAVMAAGYAKDRPCVILHGGTIKPGKYKDQEISIGDAAASLTAVDTGQISEKDRACILEHACPGIGGCGMMATSNTMAAVVAALGLSPISSASTPAADKLKVSEAALAAKYLHNLMNEGITSADIVTKESIKNAIAAFLALGGSTNAVIHLLAIAKVFEIPLSLQEFQEISNSVPVIGNIKPGGKYLMESVHKIGGMPAVFKYMVSAGLLNGNCLTVSGLSLAETVKDAPTLNFSDQDVILSVEKPLKAESSLRFVVPNDHLSSMDKIPLSPGGCVFKLNNLQGSKSFTGPAVVFESENEFVQELRAKKIVPGSVVVLRNLGPKGGPGCPELLKCTAALSGMGLDLEIALVTDGRLSGVSRGFLAVHVTPEAYDGGPIAFVKNGDSITVDGKNNQLWLHLSEKELALRKASWRQTKPDDLAGFLKFYSKLVGTASTGCVLD